MSTATPEPDPPAGSLEAPIAPDLAGAASFQVARTRWPRLRGDVVAVVLAGGCLGGLARYLVTTAWPTDGGVPWSTLAVNVSGAFVLAVMLVLATEVTSSRYLRALVGTGFCGAFTTFSSVVVSVDLLAAHHRVGAAAGYLTLSVLGGLGAAALGLVLARAVVGFGPRRRSVR